jgi:hypothetical protein
MMRKIDEKFFIRICLCNGESIPVFTVRGNAIFINGF